MKLWELIDEALVGRMTWAEVQHRAHHVPTWFEVMGTHARDEAAWREYMGPAKREWHEGASTDEVLGFRLRPGYEAYIHLLEEEELVRQLDLAVALGKDERTRTEWLTRYTGLLVDESRRRRGAA